MKVKNGTLATTVWQTKDADDCTGNARNTSEHDGDETHSPAQEMENNVTGKIVPNGGDCEKWSEAALMNEAIKHMRVQLCCLSCDVKGAMTKQQRSSADARMEMSRVAQASR